MDINSQKAILTWTWIETEGWGTFSPYTVKVVKENGIWKIAYLQGFDFRFSELEKEITDKIVDYLSGTMKISMNVNDLL